MKLLDCMRLGRWMRFKEAKSVVRRYLREVYTDRDLVRALDHARAGKLAYNSCCCFAGCPGAGERLHGDRNTMSGSEFFGPCSSFDFRAFRNDSQLASDAYCDLVSVDAGDPERRRILIPMILSEIRRRTLINRVSQREHEAEASNKER